MKEHGTKSECRRKERQKDPRVHGSKPKNNLNELWSLIIFLFTSSPKGTSLAFVAVFFLISSIQYAQFAIMDEQQFIGLLQSLMQRK
jgi:hypothetical protein